jgi:branched-subunit amino acid transport protein
MHAEDSESIILGVWVRTYFQPQLFLQMKKPVGLGTAKHAFFLFRPLKTLTFCSLMDFQG